VGVSGCLPASSRGAPCWRVSPCTPTRTCMPTTGTGTARPLRRARCAGAGAAVTSGGRSHRLSDEAPAAGRHHAPLLHRVGVAASPGVPGPPPRANLTRFHGVFAPGAKLRPFLLPQAWAWAGPKPQEASPPPEAAVKVEAKKERTPRVDWAGLLRRKESAGRLRLLWVWRLSAGAGIPDGPRWGARRFPRRGDRSVAWLWHCKVRPRHGGRQRCQPALPANCSVRNITSAHRNCPPQHSKSA
jgi:hypothetical protein